MFPVRTRTRIFRTKRRPPSHLPATSRRSAKRRRDAQPRELTAGLAWTEAASTIPPVNQNPAQRLASIPMMRPPMSAIVTAFHGAS